MNLKTKPREKVLEFKVIEVIWEKERNDVVISAYHPPPSSNNGFKEEEHFRLFCQKLNELLEEVSLMKDKNIHLIGDLNINIFKNFLMENEVRVPIIKVIFNLVER